MLTAMCPNCRHRFPVPGCCNPGPQPEPPVQQTVDCSGYYGGLLVPRGYNSNGGGCFINAPTIIHGPTIIQSNGLTGTSKIETPNLLADQLWRDQDSVNKSRCPNSQSDVQINTTCDLTGGTVTITTPSIQSGGCLIQTTDSGVIVQAPTIEIRPKLSGGGCVVQKRLSTEECPNLQYFENSPLTLDKMPAGPPSGCQELPGARHSSPTRSCAHEVKRCCCRSSCHSAPDDGMQIQVNATVQLPPNIGHCTVNITATTNPRATDGSGTPTTVRVRNNFNGGGLVNTDEPAPVEERRDDAPTTPLSWLTPCPWGFDGYPAEKDLARLQEIKRLLQISGWYHEGLSWQQSENLLKNSPVGRWLLRDSSDSRYAFAVSVQTTRGPTSVRILYSYGKFRLDAEPSLAHAMPTFDCPIKMLEYYVEYSKKIEDNRRHVWVDYSGLLFSYIYLTQPLVKEVRSLSHLARLAVAKSKLSTDNLPAPIRNYIAEYPYSF